MQTVKVSADVKAPKKVGFAVVGLGNIARGSVLPAFARSKRARLVAAVDRDKEKGARVARQFKANSFYAAEEYSACLSNPEVSAVYIATPPGAHADFAVQAARSGKHVLCEKPLAANTAQSTQMVEGCRQAGVLLMTAYRKYFEPSTLFLKRLIQDGSLGRIDMIHTAFSELYVPGVSQAWLVDREMAGGGPLMDLGVYCVNTSRWLVEEDPCGVTSVSWANDAARFRQVEEGISFRMLFPSGLSVVGSSTYSAALSSFVYVQGTKGWACLSPAFPFEVERRVTGSIAGRRVERKFKVIDEFALELDAFSAAIQEHRAVVPDGAEGHKDMIILQAIYEAASKGWPVDIKY